MDVVWKQVSGVFGPARAARPEVSTALVALAAGIVLGLAATSVPAPEALGGLVILGVLGAALSVLARAAEGSANRLPGGEASYRAFFEHAIEGIFRTTPDGHYIDANPALAQIYGYSNPAALMAGLTNIADQLYTDPARRTQFQALMQANDQVSNFDSQIRRRDGKTIWISENARAVRDWSGRIVCYEGTVEDVTARYAAQRAMADALRDAEEANRSKSAFLAAMSHELKTPLNAVLGFSEIIKEELLGPISPPRYRAYASDIHASGTRLLTIISDILDVARISGGSITLDSRPYRVAVLAEEAVTMARLATSDLRDIRLAVPQTLPQVDVDPQRLRQSLANLISNALKFTPECGVVEMRAWVAPAGGVCLSVADSGIGMAQEMITAALEPFRQLDGSLARRFEGTGLGLSISKSLVELHGGTLSIDSAVGDGTTVTIHLPPSRTVPRQALAS